MRDKYNYYAILKIEKKIEKYSVFKNSKKTICGLPKRHGITWIRVISTKHPAVKITYLIDNFYIKLMKFSEQLRRWKELKIRRNLVFRVNKNNENHIKENIREYLKRVAITF